MPPAERGAVRRLMLIAAEPSGDLLGAELMAALRDRAPGIDLIGAGGAEMLRGGLRSLFPTDKLAVMGLKDVFPAIPEVLRRAREAADAAMREQPDAAILIDSWGFCHQVGKRLRQAGYRGRIVKYATPQVWASRPHRAGVLAEYADYALTLLPFEPAHFRAAGMKADYAGNSNFQKARNSGDGAAFRAEQGIAGDAPIVILAPGSRRSELRYLLPVFEQAAERLAARFPDAVFVAPLAPNVAEAVGGAFKSWAVPVRTIAGDAQKRSAFAAANGALAASGTVTTELALSGTPVVVAYRVGWVTALWARAVMRTEYVSVLNVIAEEEALPEFL
ncbi:MAG: lipid-A-disaccharide synthase, partial [Pseudomonadota bacterium]